jgi:ferredoxin-thioredoxin reductase catalytic subunit
MKKWLLPAVAAAFVLCSSTSHALTTSFSEPSVDRVQYGKKDCPCGYDAGGDCLDCDEGTIKTCPCGYDAAGDCLPCEEQKGEGEDTENGS